MFKLKDFFHLPQIEEYFHQVAADRQPGLVLVAGVEAHPAAPAISSGFFVSSGRNMIFELLYQAPELLIIDQLDVENCAICDC